MSIRGSYHNGFAPRDAEPIYPQLWRGCVGAWSPLLGPSGLTLRDWSGFGNHGTLTNMAASSDWVVSGGRYALDFDGTDDHVVLPYKDFAMPFTVSMWLLSRSLTTNQCAFAFGNSADTDQFFSISLRGDVAGDPVAAAMRGGDSGINTRSDSLTAYPADTWFHVAAVFRSTTYRCVYLNGIAGTPDTTAHTFEPFDRMTIGALVRTTTAVYLNGQVQQLDLHNRELSENEIRLAARRPGIAYDMRSRRRHSNQDGGAAAIRRHLMLLGVGR